MEQLFKTKRQQSLNGGEWAVAVEKWAAKRFQRRYRRSVAVDDTNPAGHPVTRYKVNRTIITAITLSQLEDVRDDCQRSWEIADAIRCLEAL